MVETILVVAFGHSGFFFPRLLRRPLCPEGMNVGEDPQLLANFLPKSSPEMYYTTSEFFHRLSLHLLSAPFFSSMTFFNSAFLSAIERKSICAHFRSRRRVVLRCVALFPSPLIYFPSFVEKGNNTEDEERK